MSAAPKLSIILPCYNAPSGWHKQVLQYYLDIKDLLAVPMEMLIVNDGSTNGFNQQLLRQFYADYPEIQLGSYNPNQGKGFALREGVKKCNGELIMYTDIDFPYTEQSFYDVYQALLKGNDVAVGVRDESYYKHLSGERTRISKLLRWFIKKFLRIPTDDTQCGLKGFNQKGKQIFLSTTIDRYLFDLEFIFLAAKQKRVIQTVPVQLRPDVQLSKMNWKILSEEFGNFLKIFAKSIL
ncbi:MAG: glycosyltransferase family 2 protein [Chitinophagales bacterium]